MNELTTVAKESGQEKSIILPQHCPICNVETNYIYRMEDGRTHEQSDWFRCQCGVVFQKELPDHSLYDEKYIAALAEGKRARERYDYMLRLYAPLIEELTYGRMML